MKLSELPAGSISSVEPAPYPAEQQAFLDALTEKWEDAIAPKRQKLAQLEYGSYEWRIAADELKEFADRAVAEYMYAINKLPNPGYIARINPAAGIDYTALIKFTPLSA